MTKKEIEKCLDMVFAEFDEPSKMVKAKWALAFGHLDFDFFQKAMIHLSKKHTYGTPKIADMQSVIDDLRQAELPYFLKVDAMDVVDSQKNILVILAKEKATRQHPPISGKTQFQSEMELDKAIRIQQALWTKKYKEEFEKMQQTIIQNTPVGGDCKQTAKLLYGTGRSKQLDFVSGLIGSVYENKVIQ